MIILFLAISILYLIFLVWLRNGLETSEGPVSFKDVTELPSVAVIVAARNEEENIGHLLDHLLKQNYPEKRFEIIIANDNSSDATGDIVERFSQKDSRVKHLLVNDTPSDGSPKMWALSKAVEASKGEVMLFTDADCTMGPNWITAMVSSFRNSDVGMVTGPSPLEKKNGLWGKMLLLDSLGQDALAAGGFSRGLALTSSGRNLAIRRSAFDEVNGYEDIQSSFSGDDDLMMHKITAASWAIKFCVNPAAETKSPSPSNFHEFVKQRLRFASKGKTYYNLPFVRRAFKWILPMIFLTNLGVLIGQIMFLVTLKLVWLLPWLLKTVADGILISRYTALVTRPFHLGIFLLDELWHSVYVVVFGILGPLVPISWKGRKKDPGIV